MEYLYTAPPPLLKGLEEEIRRIPSPSSRWPELRQARGGSGTGPSADFAEVMDRLPQPTHDRREFFIPLGGHSRDPGNEIRELHRLLRRQDPVPPNAVFMGGTAETSHLAVFRRPLVPGDFARLWSA